MQALGKDKAIVVGYGGKILGTSDGGNSWEHLTSGVEDALYSVDMVDDKIGWIAGQDGLILNTVDGGKTWQRQESGATVTDKDGTTQPIYLFAIDALDTNRAFAVGDRSTLVTTTDGGKTWKVRKVAMQNDLTGGERHGLRRPDLLRRPVRRREAWLDRRRVRQDHVTPRTAARPGSSRRRA